MRRLLALAVPLFLLSAAAPDKRWERVALGPTGDLFEVDRHRIWGSGAHRNVRIRVTPGTIGPGEVSSVIFGIKVDCEKRLYAPLSATGFDATGEQSYHHDVSGTSTKPASSPNVLRIIEIACSAPSANAPIWEHDL